MTLLKIAQIGHPVLRQPARAVTPEELATPAIQRFIDDLVETMHDANGAGLAANQVYTPLRICALEVQDNPRYPYKPNIPLTILVNPVLTPLSDERFENFEGCLSVPDLRGKVWRHAEIRVQALDRRGQAIDAVARGITAGTYQHECDHLDGKLFVDRVEDPRTFCTWKEFARQHEADVREHVKAVVARYGS
ncbi:MAG: peptide deformylase [Nannocystaceae bacterium]